MAMRMGGDEMKFLSALQRGVSGFDRPLKYAPLYLISLQQQGLKMQIWGPLSRGCLKSDTSNNWLRVADKTLH